MAKGRASKILIVCKEKSAMPILCKSAGQKFVRSEWSQGFIPNLVRLEIVARSGVLEGNLQGVPQAFHLEAAAVG